MTTTRNQLALSTIEESIAAQIRLLSQAYSEMGTDFGHRDVLDAMKLVETAQVLTLLTSIVSDAINTGVRRDYGEELHQLNI